MLSDIGRCTSAMPATLIVAPRSIRIRDALRAPVSTNTALSRPNRSSFAPGISTSEFSWKNICAAARRALGGRNAWSALAALVVVSPSCSGRMLVTDEVPKRRRPPLLRVKSSSSEERAYSSARIDRLPGRLTPVVVPT